MNKPLRKIYPYLFRYKGLIGLSVLFNVLSIAFSLVSVGLVIPVLQLIFGVNGPMSESITGTSLFDQIKREFYKQIEYRLANTSVSEALLYVVIWVIVAFFFKNLFHYLGLYVIAPVRNGISFQLRRELHAKLLQLPMAFYAQRQKGDIISRITVDLREIEAAMIVLLEMIFRDPLMIIGSLAVLLWMNYKLTLFVLLTLPVVSYVISRIGRSLKRQSTTAQSQLGSLMSHIDETITGLRILKAFNAEKIKQARFERINADFYKTSNRVMRRYDLASPVSEMLGAIIMAAVIWFGGRIVIASDQFGPANFIAYILFFYQMIPPSKAISRASYNLKKGAASAERVLEILESENPITSPPSAPKITEFKEAIHFKNVHFGYREEIILHDINLTIPYGQTVALVGLSGSGKTSLVNLIPRFYDVTSGQITLDGRDIREIDLKSLRSLMGIVTQEPILFNDTVRNNIALGKPEASHEEIEEAARIANAHDFIVKLEQGFDTVVGDMGSRLSGGQRQRIAIARAILKNPPILILDEATSALDTESERLVQEAITRLMQNRTSIIIAHRLSTIRHANKIVVMDKGKIAETGTHDELLSAGGIYARLIKLQEF
ncbi:antibiotic ABC transporter ATP-binding protein [Thermaurantimonas aggregans]|uniref:Antibiotic ABC transporter ATP-binding protein n=1 Tax=Thermaurantimonas aggregans TaxID=2173829 RepID=A0A401XI73_9FLAO|nr:ABC transporter ATP-binding protein [Thermaurantimonas aggregans]GCD76674.1 antibiotic ABC transporter ATP-binding protein [Thermaurantimonas aggregans]